LHVLISLADFIAESKISASLAAQSYKCELAVSVVDTKLAIDADQALSAYAAGDRIHIDVEDSCGGLAAGEANTMLLPSARRDAGSADSGLSSCRRSVQANNGGLTVRDVPGSGCVFTIDLPRHALPPSDQGAARLVPKN
jgi:signal transduction histidine kinase